MKFCRQQQILNWINVTRSKMKTLHWTDSEFNRTYFLSLFISLLKQLVIVFVVIKVDIVK